MHAEQRLNSARIQRLIAPTRLSKSAAHRREEYADRHAEWLNGRRAWNARGSHPACAVARGTCSTGWLRTSRTSEPRRLMRTVARGSVCCVGFWFRGREFPTRGRVRPQGSRIPGQRPNEHRLGNKRLSSPEGWPGSPQRSHGLPQEASRSQGSRFQRGSPCGAIWLAQSHADRAGDSTGRFTVSNCLF